MYSTTRLYLMLLALLLPLAVAMPVPSQRQEAIPGTSAFDSITGADVPLEPALPNKATPKSRLSDFPVNPAQRAARPVWVSDMPMSGTNSPAIRPSILGPGAATLTISGQTWQVWGAGPSPDTLSLVGGQTAKWFDTTEKGRRTYDEALDVARSIHGNKLVSGSSRLSGSEQNAKDYLWIVTPKPSKSRALPDQPDFPGRKPKVARPPGLDVFRVSTGVAPVSDGQQPALQQTSQRQASIGKITIYGISYRIDGPASVGPNTAFQSSWALADKTRIATRFNTSNPSKPEDAQKSLKAYNEAVDKARRDYPTKCHYGEAQLNGVQYHWVITPK